MFTKASLTAAAIALAVPAFANPGTDQLALQLGVEPGSLSLSELIRLEDARSENDAETVRFLLSGMDTVGRADNTAAGGNAGADQLASLLGVDPGAYTVAELIRLEDARAAGDVETVRFILSGETRVETGAAGTVSPGKTQLAALLGVDPAAYTTAELIELADIDSSDD